MFNFTPKIPFKHFETHGSRESTLIEADEADRPPVLLTSIIVFFSFLFLAIVGFVAYTILWKASDTLSNVMDTGMGNPTRLEYMKKQTDLLSSYKKLENGYYQVPVTQAMEMMLKEQYQDH
jgi:hypothetical protein